MDSWLAEGQTLADRQAEQLWAIGDWWIRGEREYGDRAKLAVEYFGGWLSYGVLRNIGSTARAIEPSRRHDGVSFWKHTEVRYLSDPDKQDKLLAKIAEQDLTVKQIRKEARQADSGMIEELDGTVREMTPEEVQEDAELTASIAANEKEYRAEHREMKARIKAAGYDGGWTREQWYLVYPPPVYASCSKAGLIAFLESDAAKQIIDLINSQPGSYYQHGEHMKEVAKAMAESEKSGEDEEPDDESDPCD